MNKQHFRALVAALKASKPPHDIHDPRYSNRDHHRVSLDQWRADVRAIAVAGMPTAPTSDKGKFLARFEEACGYETTEPEAKAEAKELKS